MLILYMQAVCLYSELYWRYHLWRPENLFSLYLTVFLIFAYINLTVFSSLACFFFSFWDYRIVLWYFSEWTHFKDVILLFIDNLCERVSNQSELSICKHVTKKKINHLVRPLISYFPFPFQIQLFFFSRRIHQAICRCWLFFIYLSWHMTAYFHLCI